MSTQFDARQSRQRTALDQLSPSTNLRLDTLLNLINDEITPSLRLFASSTPNLTLNIGPLVVQTLDGTEGTKRNHIIPPIGSSFVLPTFTGGTIVFPSAPGGTVTVTPGIDPTLPAIPSGQFMKVLVGLTSTGDLSVAFGTPGATAEAATMPPSISDAFNIGYVVIQNSGGFIQSVINENIYQFAGGGGSGGAGASQYISQTSHGFAVGNLVCVDGSGSWVKAQANSGDTFALGVVSLAPDANSFIVQFSGQIKGLSGLSAGSTYFLDGATAGAYTTDEYLGSSNGYFIQPVFKATSSTVAILYPMFREAKQEQVTAGVRSLNTPELGGVTSVYVVSGSTLIHPKLVVGSGVTYDVSGTLFVPGGISGSGTVTGGGEVIS